ncbi:MAG: hypothetical protein SH857_03685, partial [Chitinophagales bacterium]|nr:hypothetical protein [Chitinophagales bacterium]
MKIFNSLVIFILSAVTLFGQVPQGIKYQAIARNEGGSILANQQITVRVTILDSAQGGLNVFSEIHKSGTNQFGLFNVSIGQGINPTGTFSNIPWATGNKWLQIEFDPVGGLNFQLMGISELLSVPYALYAGNGGGSGGATISSVQFDPNSNQLTITESGANFNTTITEETDDLSDNVLNDLADVNTAAPVINQILKWNGTEWAASTDETNDQNLAIINNQLSITSGNSIDLTPFLDNTDSQVLSYNPTTHILTLQNGGTVDLTDLLNDADANPLNEIQDLSLNGNQLSLTNSSITITLPSNTGNGIDSTIDNGNGTLTFLYTDGSYFTTSDLTGPQGPTGANGVDGTNGIDGIDGTQGPQGIPGLDGLNGQDGNGIDTTIDNGNGTLTFLYSDGSTFTTANLTGPAGAQGSAGANGIDGAQGSQGIPGLDGLNGQDGQNGNGIDSTIDNGNGTLTFLY